MNHHVETDEEKLTFKMENVRVLPGQRVQVVRRPRRSPFLWQRFEVEEPELWTILNVVIGCNSLFKENPGGGAGVLAPRLNEEGLLCKEVCRAAEDFSIEAMYVGTDPEGAAFDCTVTGRVPR